MWVPYTSLLRCGNPESHLGQDPCLRSETWGTHFASPQNCCGVNHPTTGTFQMSAQYCRMVRSDENLPDRAVFSSDMRPQCAVSR